MQQLDTQTIKPGFQFKNNSMRLTVVHFYGTDKRNLALLVRENDACPYITVRDCPKRKTAVTTGRGGITFPTLTRRSKITGNGFPNFRDDITKHE